MTSLARVDTRYVSLGLVPTSWPLQGLRYIRWEVLLPTNLVITSYTHKPWHRRYFLNREPPYCLQSSITGSAFRGFILVLQKNSMLDDTQMFRSKMGAFRCIHTCHPLRLVFELGEGCLKCLLRSAWIIAQQVRHNRL